MPKNQPTAAQKARRAGGKYITVLRWEEGVAQGRAMVAAELDRCRQLGEIILRGASADRSDAEVAADPNFRWFIGEVGLTADEALAYRRYAITRDRRDLPADAAL
ncbi:hypothetical protein AB0D04_02035 [Streptomyces sp. NPDC048483]|uniref:hypothetical protein n=1 Tax=Streptomyces sp. NPDC048483 TaxID=3154927 RepID=UPI003427502B